MAAAAACGCKTVFVATSLDTHLAMTLSSSHTVADFKRKIILQHGQCFPGIGPLRIRSLKVKYQGKFYHLHEGDMLVSSAFEGNKGRWSLFVDAVTSSEVVKEQKSVDPFDKCKADSQRVPQAIQAITWKSPGESSGATGMEVAHVHGTWEDFPLVNQNLVEKISKSKDDLEDKNENFQSHNSNADEPRSEVGLTAKQRQKIGHSVHVAPESAFVMGRTSLNGTTSHRSSDKNAGVEDSFVGAGQKDLSDLPIGAKDAGKSPYKNSFLSMNVSPELGTFDQLQSEHAAEKSCVFEKEEVRRHNSDHSITKQVSDLENIAPKKSVNDGMENMTSLNVPFQQLQEEHPAISVNSKKGKKKRKKQPEGTNSDVPDDQAATSNSGTVLQGSVLQEVCGSKILGIGNHSKTDNKIMLAPAGNGQNDYNEEDGQLSSNHDVQLSESVKPSDHVETTIIKKELVLGPGMLGGNKSVKSVEVSDSGGSKSKKRKAKKSAVQKQDQSDSEHDLSAPSRISVAIEGDTLKAHIEDQLKIGESVLPQNDPNKSEANSELAKIHVPVVICSEGNKHLDSGEANLVKKESASDIALNGRDDSEAGKSGGFQKKKKGKKSTANNGYHIVKHTTDANDPLALKDSRSKHITDEVIAAQSIFSYIEENEESMTVSATDSNKKRNIASEDDKVSLPSTSVDHIYSRNENLVLNSGKEYNNNQSQDRATVQDQVNVEQAKEAQCLPVDRADGDLENKGTTKKKRKKKAKGTGNSSGGGLGISEISQQNICDDDLVSSVEKLVDVDYAVNDSDEKRTVDQSGVSELGAEKNAGLKCTVKLEKFEQNADMPEVPPSVFENNCGVRHAIAASMGNIAIASLDENGSVNSRHYFVPGEDHREAASTDKVQEESNMVEGTNKAEKHKVVPEGKHRPSKAQGNQKNSCGRNSDDNKHASSSSKAKQNKNVSEKEISINSRKRSKAPNSSDVKVKTLQKSVGPAVVNGSDSTRTVRSQLEENDESWTSSNFNSSTRGSKKVLLSKTNQKRQIGINHSGSAVGNFSRKKVGDIDKSSQETSLLTIPGALFEDGGSESSGDEHGFGKSGSTTQSPSCSSSSSGDSISEGSNISERDHGSRKNASSSKMPDPRSMSMDMILRRSSRFKKAKLAASWCEAVDTESQPVDFVPESQPIR